MKPSSSNSRSKGHAKARRKTREELDQEARDRKRQKKRRGHAPGSRAAGGNTTSGSKGQNAPKDPRIGSKTPIPLGVTEKVTKQHKPKSEKPMLSPQAELELLETNTLRLPNTPQVTLRISVGVAPLNPQMSHYREWLKSADLALYKAKKAGRNRTEVAA